MKEKIKNMSKGIFEFQLPELVLSDANLDIKVEEGKIHKGLFTVQNSNHTFLKGVVYSSSELLRIVNSNFSGTMNQIDYEFNAQNLSMGEVSKGEIQLVTSCGEISLPFHITVEAPSCSTSLGKINNLFHFTNLAKEDAANAVRLFKSDEFSSVFLFQEPKYKVLYKSLIKSMSPSQAMEEFLVAVNKKIKVNISIDKNFKEYTVKEESFQDKVLITKGNWGYLELKVSTDVDFIRPDHKIIWGEYFIGSSYPLEFVVLPENLREGKNVGHIYLKSTYQSFEIEVVCHKGEHKVNLKRFEEKNDTYKLTKAYLDFRMKYITVDKYVTTLHHIYDGKEGHYYDLLRIHVNLIYNKRSEAKEILDKLYEQKDQLKEDSFLYSGYLYLLAIFNKDNASIIEAANFIKECYSATKDWRSLWFLLFLDKTYEKDINSKLKVLKSEIEQGNKSPILYLEACQIFNDDALHLAELKSFELKCISWGMKHNFLNKDVMSQFAYLANREKKYSRIVCQSLVRIYDSLSSKEVLTAICRLLIIGQMTSTRYFRWYELGVEAGLKITQLHEFYMYSLDEHESLTLAQPILMYFVYNSTLSDSKKAYLYSYIIKHKDKLLTVYQSYLKQMELFTMNQLAKHNVSENLVTLYEEFVLPGKMSVDMVKELGSILFTHEIYCMNSAIKGVVVVHKELDGEVYVPLSNGYAYVNIFTDNAQLILVDQNDHRYANTIEYQIRSFFTIDYYINECFSLFQGNYMVDLYLLEKAETYQKQDETAMELRRLALSFDRLSESYRQKLYVVLIQYCYDHLHEELLKEYLAQIQIVGLSKSQRTSMIEHFILNEMYDKALEAIGKFGYESIGIKKLVKLCTRLLDEKEDLSKELSFIQLVHYVFTNGKYNDVMLTYLIENYYGTTKEMFYLWKAAKDFELDTLVLEERLLAQILFAESYITDSMAVFLSYYRKGSNKVLIRAFLTYYAYKYLVNDRIIKYELFDIIKRELHYEENEICTMALLKHYSYAGEWSDDDTKFVEIELNKAIENGTILPFFKEFSDRIRLPESITNKYFVEYKADPNKKVTIHYRLITSEDTEFITETMKDVYLGIRMKEFVLFYNEELQYYILEESEDGENITESFNIRRDSTFSEVEDTKYSQINLMIMTNEIKDDKTLIELMENYVKTDYLTKNLFKPL